MPLNKKSILANFPSYIRNFSESRTSSTSIIDELVKIRFKKPDGRPKFTPEVLQFALILRYTSLSACKLLLNHFPLPSIRLLNKLSAGGVEPLKSAKLLLNEKKMDKDVILLLDEMYLQKEVQYHQGQLLGTDQDGNLYKGIVTFMIVGLRKNIPFVVRAVPESKIEEKWLSQHINECLKSLHQVGFEVHAVISDNHATNVAAFRDLFSKYGHSKLANAITHPSLSSLTT